MLSDAIGKRAIARRPRAIQTTEVLTVIATLALFFGFGWMILMAMV